MEENHYRDPPCENGSSGTCGQRRPWSDCADAQSDQGHLCPLTQSLARDTTESMKCLNGTETPVFFLLCALSFQMKTLQILLYGNRQHRFPWSNSSTDGFLLLQYSSGVFDTPRISKCLITLFLWSPHLCVIIGWVWRPPQSYIFLPLWKLRTTVGTP